MIYTTSRRLFVSRSMTQGNRWRLLWAIPGDTMFVWTDGECSARTFNRMCDAVAFGNHEYGEKARRVDLHDGLPFPA